MRKSSAHAVALLPEGALPKCVSLFGSFAKPFDRFCIILGNSISNLIHRPEDILRLYVSMVRSFAIPFDCFDSIFWHISKPGHISNFIRVPEVVLRVCISSFCVLPQLFKRRSASFFLVTRLRGRCNGRSRMQTAWGACGVHGLRSQR